MCSLESVKSEYVNVNVFWERVRFDEKQFNFQSVPSKLLYDFTVWTDISLRKWWHNFRMNGSSVPLIFSMLEQR